MDSDRTGLAIATAILVAAAGFGYIAFRRAQSPGAPQPIPSVGKVPANRLGNLPESRSPATASSSPTTPARPDSAPVKMLRVQVAGAVRRPGLYNLPATTRVEDAIRTAGGALPTADLERMDLARYITDGQTIRVPLLARPKPPSPTRRQSAKLPPATPQQPVNLNSATREQLETVPGIGPKTAQLIIDFRQRNGPFQRVADLAYVPSIGELTLDRIFPYVTVR